MLNLAPESVQCQFLNDYLEQRYGDVLEALRLMRLSPIPLALLDSFDVEPTSAGMYFTACFLAHLKAKIML